MARYSSRMLLVAMLGASAVAAVHAQQQTFYDVLKADPAHRLIMRAVESDPSGKLKALLQQTAPITAFVPTDSAFIKSAVKLRGHKGVDAGSVMKNHCLIGAILKQHMLPGVYDTNRLAALAGKPGQASMLVTKKMVPNTKGKLTVSWPLQFSKGDGKDLSVASAAQMPDPKAPAKKVAATTGTLVAPMNVRAGSGIIHNINGLLLPMNDLARMMKVTNCQPAST